MKNLFVTIVLCFCFQNINSQTNVGINDCAWMNTPSMKLYMKNLWNATKNTSYKTNAGGGNGLNCNLKILKINIYIIQDSLGKNNFTSYDDGMGNPYNGMQYCHDLLAGLNWSYANNEKMRIPPLNNIPIEEKNIQFVLNGIYYIKSNRLNHFTDTVRVANWDSFNNPETLTETDYLSLRKNADSVFHLFLQDGGIFAEYNSNYLTNQLPKYTFKKAKAGWGVNYGEYMALQTYSRYRQYVNKELNGDQLGYVLQGNSDLFIHELGHAIGLNHTVLWPDGSLCETRKLNDTFYESCGDIFENNTTETPSAWYMMDTLNAPYHPGLRSNDPLVVANGLSWLSNNRLDYSGGNALAPQQIQFSHTFISTNQRNKLIETNQKANLTLCYISDIERISYYGKKVSITNSCSNAFVIQNSKKKVYFTDSVEFLDNFEVKGGEFELISTCSK